MPASGAGVSAFAAGVCSFWPSGTGRAAGAKTAGGVCIPVVTGGNDANARDADFVCGARGCCPDICGGVCGTFSVGTAIAAGITDPAVFGAGALGNAACRGAAFGMFGTEDETVDVRVVVAPGCACGCNVPFSDSAPSDVGKIGSAAFATGTFIGTAPSPAADAPTASGCNSDFVFGIDATMAWIVVSAIGDVSDCAVSIAMSTANGDSPCGDPAIDAPTAPMPVRSGGPEAGGEAAVGEGDVVSIHKSKGRRAKPVASPGPIAPYAAKHAPHQQKACILRRAPAGFVRALWRQTARHDLPVRQSLPPPDASRSEKKPLSAALYAVPRLASPLHGAVPEARFCARERIRSVSINGVLGAGLTAVQTNSAALRVTATNIANVNTPDYVRRIAQMETLAPGGQLSGVTLSDVQRAVSSYYDTEAINAQGASSSYDAQSSLMDQLNAAMGTPGDGASLSSKLDALYSALGQASLDPTLMANRQGALNQFQSVASTISDLATSVSQLRQSADQQIGSAVQSANDLFKQIYDVNREIQHAVIGGDHASGLLDQRDQLVQQLSKLVGIHTVQQSDGQLFISTQDGVSLVGDTYVQLNYRPSSGPSYFPITVQTVNPNTGQGVGTVQPFDAHTEAGSLHGFLSMRDGTLQQVGEELGTFAQSLALAYNAQNNSNVAVPPPTSLTGRETGLVASDALNFTGRTTIGITSADGTLQHKVTVNFDAGTLTVDGTPSGSLGTTVGDFATALNSALGSVGASADFSNGVLSMAATGGNGLVVTDDPSDLTARGGVAFSHFFGLNDLFQASGNSIQTTGLSASDLGDFNPGGSISLLLKGPNGERVNETTVNVTGSTIGDMVGALNTAFAGKATFALDSSGQLSVTPSGSYKGYTLEVTQDTTARGTTGVSFSQLFGLGSGEAAARAIGFRLTESANSPDRQAFAESSLGPATALGTQIVGPGDNRGLLALQAIASTPISFGAAGNLPARTTTLNDYAATFYQDIAARGTTIDAGDTAQSTRLDQAQKNKGQAEGVNLDEELTNMMSLQQAYNAGARLLKVANDLFDQLVNVL